MTKTIIAPIIAVLALAVQAIFGVTIPEEILNEVVMTVVNAGLLVTAIIGVFKNYNEKRKKEATRITKHID